MGASDIPCESALSPISHQGNAKLTTSRLPLASLGTPSVANEAEPGRWEMMWLGRGEISAATLEEKPTPMTQFHF